MGIGWRKESSLPYSCKHREVKRPLRTQSKPDVLDPRALGLQTLGSAPWSDLKRRGEGWAPALLSLTSDSMHAVQLQAPAESRAVGTGPWGDLHAVCTGAVATGLCPTPPPPRDKSVLQGTPRENPVPVACRKYGRGRRPRRPRRFDSSQA